jgi:hypothetical protein
MPTCLALLVTLALFLPAAAGAQIFRVGTSNEPAFWVTGGLGYLSHGRVHDGATQSRWDFAGGMQFRASVERAIQRESAIGVTATWAELPLVFRSLDGTFPARDATANVWQVIATFHAGGGQGFHQVLQVNAGMAGYTGFVADDTGETLPPSDQNLTFSIGYGFGYALGRRTHINVVQDFGYVFHSRQGLPGDISGSAQTSTLRIALRYGAGRRGL